MSLLKQLKSELGSKANSKKAKLLAGFFKTGKGEYAEGDIFLGITVPETRKTAKNFKDLPLAEVEELLRSPIHEERLCAILLLVHNFNSGDDGVKKEIFDFYLKNTSKINNWDLVDLSSHKIIGEYLKNKSRDVLYSLARSKNLWERRIAIISTFAFIRDGDFEEALKISEMLLGDKHDLIHKAVGWVLREIGKKDLGVEERFLRKNYPRLPRTTLRYAIERFPEAKRKAFLNGNI